MALFSGRTSMLEVQNRALLKSAGERTQRISELERELQQSCGDHVLIRRPPRVMDRVFGSDNCLQAAEKTEDPLAREMLLRHALEWMRDGLAASKHSKLCAVCGRKAAPGSSLVH